MIFIPIIFFFISFVFSMLGMGGSQIYIPILFWSGLDFKTQAIPLGMLLNVVNSSSAAFTYARKKLIDWKLGILFGITMLIFAPFGTYFSKLVSAKFLIFVFAIFTSLAATLMWIGWQPEGEISGGKKIFLGFFGGGSLGFLAGLIGRGGGSFVVPLLYMSGIGIKTASATSALTVTFSGLSSFISHIVMGANPDWKLWIECVISVFLGSQLGSNFMVKKLKGKALKRVFALVLYFVSFVLIFKDVIFTK